MKTFAVITIAILTILSVNLPMFGALLMLVLIIGTPISAAIALPVHAISKRRQARAALNDFRHAYTALKRAEADPYGDADHMRAVAHAALYRLQQVKP